MNGSDVAPGTPYLLADLPVGVWLRSGAFEVAPAPEPVAEEAAEEEASE